MRAIEGTAKRSGGTSSASRGARAVAARTGRVTLENLAAWELEQPLVTRLVYNDKKGININSQSEHIKKFGQALIKEFHKIQAFEYGTSTNSGDNTANDVPLIMTGFFPADEKFQIQRDIINRVAEDTKVEKPIKKRLRYDTLYVSMFAKLVGFHASAVRVPV